jgi:hypothetical protein
VASRENDLFQQDERVAEVKAAPSNSEFDPHDDLLTNIFQDIFQELLMSGVKENDFSVFE